MRNILRLLPDFTRYRRAFQILWDASEIQQQERSYLTQMGKITMNLARNGELKHPEVLRLLAKYERHEMLLERLENSLHSYQSSKDSDNLYHEVKEELGRHGT